MKLLRSIFIALILLMISFPMHTSAEEASLKELDTIADEALQMTKSGRFDEAKQLLQYFSDKFSEVNARDRSFSMDELRILTVAHEGALQSLANTSESIEQRIDSVITFRLVMDTISSQHQPLWTEMEKPIMSAFQQMQTAANEGDTEAYHSTLNQFLTKYSIIQPSIKLDVPVEKVQQLDSRITFIDRYRSESGSSTETINELNTLEDDLEKLFDGLTEDEADPSLWWVITTTGSIIILTLSYVGWRKYKGESEQSRSERQKD
ncbi:sporulation protein YpjB [Rossellomorea vietnamensis]|uniref:Sporulation protein YpjB n=2 Tax=Rossellomorea TaxID=2837508 RepID=A0A5D4KGV1_9BACI|nr:MULTISPECIES: sporulation protein YpjB [Rossellomorea]TYR76472.1 sporulation protein YpjB [Rossellomorea vietnamensis]TYS79299.1 sporulation protein YpjB [Rossellomorea aquimaris]